MEKKEQHKDFILRCISEKTRLFYLSSSLRISTLQWALTSLHLLGEVSLVENLSNKMEIFLSQCQNEDGGFGANRKYPSSSVSTLSALQIIHLLKKNHLLYLKMKKENKHRSLEPEKKRAGEFTIQDRLNEIISQSTDLENDKEDKDIEQEINLDSTSEESKDKTNEKKSTATIDNISNEKKDESNEKKDESNEKKDESKDKPKDKPLETSKDKSEEKPKQTPTEKTKPTPTEKTQEINYLMCNAYLETIISDQKLTPHRNEDLNIRSIFCYVISKSLLSQINTGGPEYFTILSPIKKKICKYIYSCINKDGAMGTEPGCESHAAYTLCGISILFIFGQIEVLDMFMCAKMLAMLQNKTGGFSSRVDTVPSLSSSFWAYSALSLIEKSFYIDKAALEKYIEKCTCNFGGFSDQPDSSPTLLHTVSAISLICILNGTLTLEDIPYLALYLHE